MTLDPKVYREAAQVLRNSRWYPGETKNVTMLGGGNHCAATAIEKALYHLQPDVERTLFGTYCAYPMQLLDVDLAVPGSTMNVLATWNDRHAADKNEVIALLEKAATSLEREQDQAKDDGWRQFAAAITAPADPVPALEELFADATL